MKLDLLDASAVGCVVVALALAALGGGFWPVIVFATVGIIFEMLALG